MNASISRFISLPPFRSISKNHVLLTSLYVDGPIFTKKNRGRGKGIPDEKGGASSSRESSREVGRTNMQMGRDPPVQVARARGASRPRRPAPPARRPPMLWHWLRLTGWVGLGWLQWVIFWGSRAFLMNSNRLWWFCEKIIAVGYVSKRLRNDW